MVSRQLMVDSIIALQTIQPPVVVVQNQAAIYLKNRRIIGRPWAHQLSYFRRRDASLKLIFGPEATSIDYFVCPSVRLSARKKCMYEFLNHHKDVPYYDLKRTIVKLTKKII